MLSVIGMRLINAGLVVIVSTILITSLGKVFLPQEFLSLVVDVNFAVVSASLAACLAGAGFYVRRRSVDQIDTARADQEIDRTKRGATSDSQGSDSAEQDTARADAAGEERVKSATDLLGFAETRHGVLTPALHQFPDLRRQTATICFFEIQGFSRACEVFRDNAALISGFVQDYAKLVSDVVTEYRGVVDRFLGDEVISVFGALSQELDEGYRGAQNAVMAALRMKQGFEELSSQWQQQWHVYSPERVEVGFSCAIHTGDTILLPNPEPGIRDRYTAMGLAVMFASRLASQAQAGQILVSASTMARVESKVALEMAGVMSQVKSVPGAPAVYVVVGSK